MLWSRLQDAQRARRTRRTLQSLDDQMLTDIGVSRTAIEWVALHDAAREIVRTRALASCRRLSRAEPSALPSSRPTSKERPDGRPHRGQAGLML